MNQPPGYVRSDTPDPRVGAYNIEDVSPPRAGMDISSSWPYMGTNNSALKGSTVNSTMTTDYGWIPPTIGLHDNPLFSYNASNFKHKRHWQSDDRFLDDIPPCKVRINEEKVAQQFHSMSLHSETQSTRPASSSNTSPHTVSAMWDRFHELEDKLNSSSDIEIDEGVDMGNDVEPPNLADNSMQEPILHISPDLKTTISATNGLPQILVPKPCREVVLWQPTGVDLIKESVVPKQNHASSSVVEDHKMTRKKKTATRTLSSNLSLLSVPTIRPDTPPPDAKANPLSQDIPVCFIDEPGNDSVMDMQ